MTPLEEIIRAVASELDGAGVPFAVIGGLAVSVRTEPRSTRDADLAVSVASDAAAEALVFRLLAAGFAVDSVLEHDTAARLATVRISRQGTERGPVVDLLFASSGIEPEVTVGAERLEVLPGFQVPIARTGHLIALKLLSRDDTNRPQDVIDLHALIGTASDVERDRARQAVALIEARGFNRGRNLAGDLAHLL